MAITPCKPLSTPSTMSAATTASHAPAPRRPWLPVAALLLTLEGCVVAPARPYHPPPAPPQIVYRAPAPVPEVAPPQATYFYAERGQSEAQQDRDRYECYRWAVRETGTDPGMTPVRQPLLVQSAPPVRDGAPVVGGAVVGAAVGSVLSGPRHMGEGAVLGAIFGAVVGAAAQEQQAQAAERSAERAQARNAAALDAARRPSDSFRRAVSACMGGRGYRVG